MKKIKLIKFFSVVLFVAIFVTGCSNNDDSIIEPPPYQNEEPTIFGEWFEDASEGKTQIYLTNNYKEDGTSKVWFGYASASNSILYDYDATYSYDNNIVIEKYVDPISGDNITEEYKVNGLTKYTLTLYYAPQETTSTQHRIVDTYNLSVGDTKSFIINDPNFVASEYYSTNSGVATVDNSGNIVAVKRGFSFVCAKSSIGTAVIRVIVTDSENVIDDFSSFLGKPIEEVEKVYGNNYYEFAGDVQTERVYALMDEKIADVDFMYMGKVYNIVVDLRDGVDSNSIIDSFKKKYNLQSESSVSARFNTEIDGQKYAIFYYIKDGKIKYMTDMTPEPEEGNYSSASFEEYNNLITLGTVTNVANQLGYQLTDEDMEDGFFNKTVSNEVFDRVSVSFDEDPESDDYLQVSSVSLRAKSGVTQEDIEYWYKNNYTATGDEKNPYSSSTSPVYYVSFKKNGSRIYVNYQFRKNK